MSSVRRDDDHRIVRVERVEDQLIGRIIDAGDAARLRFLLREEHDDEIVFVVAGIGDDDVGAADSRRVEDHRVATIADDRHLSIDQTLEHLGLPLDLLDDHHLMALVDQRAGEIGADFAAADD